MPLIVFYLVPDVSDPAVARRLRALKLGGAEPRLAGFRRSASPIREIEGVPVHDLGQTQDAKLAARVFSVAKVSVRISRLESAVRGADVAIAKNLEMLSIAARARSRFAPHAGLVYECLDIHRLLLSNSLPGKLLRRLETRLWRDVDLLLTSSPAFVREYFQPRQFPAPIRLVENKVLNTTANSKVRAAAKRAEGAPPWRIGVFGMIRCRRSLEILSKLSQSLAGAVEIVVRGRPSPAIFPDFDAFVRDRSGILFGGPYKNPEDLGSIYGAVHFIWCIDYYEASQNSAWLLPNRIYEGSLHSAVPIALSDVETGRWLKERGAGLLLPDPPDASLTAFFRHLDPAAYERLAESVARLPIHDLADDEETCLELVQSLSRLQSRKSKIPITFKTAASS